MKWRLLVQNNPIPIVRARGLNVGYTKKIMVLKNCSFDIYPKEIIIITGVSGSGKSTLLKTLYGELPFSQGDLYINQFLMSNIKDADLMKCRKELGIIFQDYRLINEWSVSKNIELPLHLKGISPSIRKKQVKKLLSHVKLELKINHYPLELSGGEQQRVAVARAIGHNPKILLADEPTGNLDEYSSEVIWDLLQGANQHLDMTLVVVTHKVPQNLNKYYRHFHIENGVLYDNS